ncbi:mitochondrial ribosomal small subunit component [Coemansia sp. RSA 2708]|nr:mitochondrial ribosomal small subunit component [Coemansia sp. RSA 2708]
MYDKLAAARGIKSAYERLLGANLRGEVPPWLHAMRTTPPVDSLVREPSTFATRGQLDFEATARAQSQGSGGQGAQIRRTIPEGCVARSHKKRDLRTRCNQPPRIEFPEDRLRKEFYRNHPFERLNPRIMLEHAGKRPQKWSRLADGGGQVTGESVIRYQHYLMEASGLSKQEAYAQATKEFYAVRAREEMEAKIAQQEAHFYGAQPLKKPFSAHQLAVEDKEICKNADVFAARQEEQRMRDVLSEKMFVAAAEGS